MLQFAANTDVSLLFPFTYNGDRIVLTSFMYQVLDANGAILIDWTTPSIDPDTEGVTITVLRAFNATSTKRDLRTVRGKLTTAQGDYYQTQVYMLTNDVLQLTVMTDSFMTFGEAMMSRLTLTETVDNYDEITDEYKAVALENAYLGLIKLRYRFGGTYDTSDACNPSITYSGTSIDDFSTVSAITFATYPTAFKEALKKAQIIEADYLVENSPVKDKMRLGIISETIGESSMFFRTSGPMMTRYPGLSDRAYVYLSPFLFREAVNSQIWKVRRS